MNQNTPQDAPPAASSRSRRRRRILIGLFLLVCGGIAWRVYSFLAPVALEVGPETTVIEGPLLPDGRVDYIAALNEQIGEGVTPDNNAAVPLLQAFGPENVDAEQRREFFQLLGDSEPPLEGDYVIEWDAWVRRDVPPSESIDREQARTLEDQFGTAMQQPWSREEFPEVAAWLDANAAPLELIVEATARPRFCTPLVSTGEPPLIYALRSQKEARSAARLLTVRAMLRLGNGDIEDAWDDLLACHRLSRLVGQEVTTINNLVGTAIASMAVRASASLSHDAQFNMEQAQRFLVDLDALTPLPGFAATIDVGERFMALDAIQSLAVGNGTGVSSGLEVFAGRGLDWSLMMQITNERYDELVEAFGQVSYQARSESFDSLDAEIESELMGTSTPKLIAAALIGSRRQLSRQVANVVFATLCPAGAQLCIAETRAETRLRLLRIALVLGAYRAHHGTYPDALDQLTPDYLAQIPLDPFPDEPLKYERTEEGYRLYSVGDNLTDDGGLTYDSTPEGDDLIIQFPAPRENLPGEQYAGDLLANDMDIYEQYWFVSPDGDDAADGSESTPLRTLAAALDTAQSGDTISLNPGIYEGDVQTQRPGVTITGPRDAVVHGPEDARGINVLHDRTVLRGFTIEHLSVGVWVFGTEECRLEDLLVQDIGREGVRIRNGSSDNIVRGCRFERMGLEGFDLAARRKNGEGVYIGTAPEQRDENDPPNVPDRCTGNIVEDCTFDTEAAEAVDIKEDSEENIVRECHAEDSRDPDGAVFGSQGDRNQFIACIALGGRGHGFRFGGDTVQAGQFGQEEDRTYGRGNVMRNCHAEYNGRWGAAPMVQTQDIDDSNTWLGNALGNVRP